MKARPRHKLLVALLTGVAVLGATGAPAATASSGAASSGSGESERATVEPVVTEQIADQGAATFWVALDSEADLNRPDGADSDAASVYAAKTEHAERTQAGLRELLTERGVEFTPFWIVNQIQVTGDAALLAELAARPEVARIEAEDVVELPQTLPADPEPTVDSVEWNIDRINAPRVWNELGVRGEGVVIAHIDSGVLYDHPALVGSYRGTRPDGTFDHNHNWFDPTRICSSQRPCDQNFHGTHTMGTMVGLDGDNQIGVAPGAKWISAKGCAVVCAEPDLLAAGQWILAPTDVNGDNPRPDLAPNVVNNSWGLALAEDPWYIEMVRAWVAAGIFPAFSNGNDGPDCVTSGTPAYYAESYSSGAFDADGVIADFSSRGPTIGGRLKPNIAAPGVNIRSAVDGYTYRAVSGTSMASPHTAATVALMWSRSPSLVGDIEATRAVLDRTAIDTDDTSCGGTPERNNVYGEGRLDAYAAVSATPRDPIGDLSGLVSAGGAPVADAAIELTGPVTRRIDTGADGRYALTRLPVGEYAIEVTSFHHEDSTTTVTVTEGGTAAVEHALVRRLHAVVSGTVGSSGGVPYETTVRAVGTPASSNVDEHGGYSLDLPLGAYELAFGAVSRCVDPVTRPVTLSEDTTVDVTLPDRVGDSGYRCRHDDSDWIEGTEQLDIHPQGGIAQVELPFSFPLFGRSYRQAWVTGFGVVAFRPVDGSHGDNTELPNAAMGPALFPAWNRWSTWGYVHTAVVGTAPNRTYVVEWRDAWDSGGSGHQLHFAAHLHEDGTVTYKYRPTDGHWLQRPSNTTIGLQDGAGQAFQYSFDESVIHGDLSIRFQPGDRTVVRGSVTDGNDGGPVAGASVTLRAGGEVVGSGATAADGSYLAQVPPGEYDAVVTADHYRTVTGQVSVGPDGATFDATLPTAVVTGPSDGLRVVVPPGESRDRSFAIVNSGAAGTGFTVAEATDVPWLTVDTASGSLEPAADGTVELSLDTAGLAPGIVHQVDVVVASDSGRSPEFTVPVTVVVPAYQVALDSGSPDETLDSLGDRWLPDQSYTRGSYGYLGRSREEHTYRDIAGTEDDERFQDLRSGMDRYQFDGLADGTYTVELDFAELRSLGPGRRIFDVVIEGTRALPALDVTYDAGARTALRHAHTVQVTDGTLDVQFIEQRGYGEPMVNAIRVTHRPDLAPAGR